MELIIINVCINSESVFTGTDAAELTSIFAILDVKSPIEVFTTGQLQEVLETNKDKKCLLSSILPPNNSYPNSKSYEGNLRDANIWKADSYSNSVSLFEEINSKISNVDFLLYKKGYYSKER